MRNDFKRVSDYVQSGEKVLIARPRNENLVVISEKEYNELEKARRNIEYLDKLDRAIQNVAEGKTVSFTMEEFESLDTMSPEEARAFVAQLRARQGK